MRTERITRGPGRALPAMLLAAALVLIAACGGDDSKAEKKTRDGGATAAPAAALGQASGAAATAEPTQAARPAASPAPANATRALDLDCGRELKAFKFNGKLALQSPQTAGSGGADPAAIITGLLQDVKFSGAFLAPDRTSFKLEGGGNNSLLGGQAIEFVQIGNTSYTKLGNTGWQQATGEGAFGGFTEGLDPRELCKQFQDNLRGDVPSRKEKVNGVDAVRYDYDRKTLERLGQNGGGFLDGLTGEELPENFKLNLWVSEKEKFPVKMLMSGSGTQNGEKYSFDMEFNVSDLNGNVRIDPPR